MVADRADTDTVRDWLQEDVAVAVDVGPGGNETLGTGILWPATCLPSGLLAYSLSRIKVVICRTSTIYLHQSVKTII